MATAVASTTTDRRTTLEPVGTMDVIARARAAAVESGAVSRRPRMLSRAISPRVMAAMKTSSTSATPLSRRT